MTGYGEAAVLEELKGLGIHRLLEKPYGPETLTAAVGETSRRA